MNKRINFIDIAKAIAIFYIVFGHTIVHSANSDLSLRFVCSFHVVLFFVLSGYTFSIKKDFKILFKTKFIRIVIPYLFWAIIFLIPYFLLGQDAAQQLETEQSFDIIFMLKNILYGNGNAASLKQNSSLWFLPALFTIEIIYYFIIKYLAKNKKSKVFLLIILLVGGYISSKYLQIILPFGINTAINVGVFFYIGYLLKETDILNKSNTYFITIFSIIIGCFACYYGNKIHLSYIDFYYGNYFYMILSGCFLSLFSIGISKIINNNKILEYIGKNTMGILIFHKLFVIIFQTKLGTISNLIMDSNLLIETVLGIIISCIAIALSLIVTYPIKKICPLLIGEKNKKKTLLDN